LGIALSSLGVFGVPCLERAVFHPLLGVGTELSLTNARSDPAAVHDFGFLG
jgi:hypothetical protein